MIIGHLMGGLGNQLFQIFTTIAYAIREKHPFAFPETVNPGQPNRPNYWSSFLVKLRIFTKNYLPKTDILREKGFEYEELPKCKYENLILSGYFQSHKYFDEYFGTICNMIGVEKHRKVVSANYPNDYSTAISMHFRLGDYKKLQDKHPILSYEYYRSALLYIHSKKTNVYKVLYFCEKEDNETVEKMINRLRYDSTLSHLVFVKAPDDIADWQQMLMMSLCAHNIIANSTFSWWGAQFNTNADKLVCYPSVWFGPALKEKTVFDLFPDSWIKIG